MNFRRITAAIGIVTMAVMFAAFLHSITIFSANGFEYKLYAATLLVGTNLSGTTVFGWIIGRMVVFFHNFGFILLFL